MTLVKIERLIHILIHTDCRVKQKATKIWLRLLERLSDSRRSWTAACAAELKLPALYWNHPFFENCWSVMLAGRIGLASVIAYALFHAEHLNKPLGGQKYPTEDCKFKRVLMGISSE